MDAQFWVGAALGVVLIVAFLFTRINGKIGSAATAIPFFPGIPYLGSIIPFAGDAMKFLDAKRAQYGSSFSTVLIGQKITFLTNPLDFSSIWRNAATFSFNDVGDSIVASFTSMPKAKAATMNGEVVHKLWIQYLQGSSLQQSNAIVAKALQHKLAQLVPNAQNQPDAWERHRLREFTSRLLFDVGVQAVFGRGIDTDSLITAFNTVDAEFPKVAGGLPALLLKRAHSARDELAAALLQQQREQPDGSSELIRKRIAFFREQGLNDLEIARINVLLLWALHANTSPVIFWFVAYLMEDSSAMATVLKEVDELFLTQPDFLDHPDKLSATLDSLRAVSSAAQETLRLCASSFGLRDIVREGVIHPVDADGQEQRVSPGERVILVTSHHRDETVFANPTKFTFSRFIPGPDGEAPEFFRDGKVIRQPVMAFGGGVSMCPGRYLALNEVRLAVVMLLRHYEIRRAVEDAGKPLPPMDKSRAGLGTLPPAHDIDFEIRCRKL